MQTSGAREAVQVSAANVRALDVPLWLKLVFKLIAQIEHGALSVALPDGRAFRFAGRVPGKEGILIVRDFRFARRALLGGSLGLAEGYLAGEWESPDVAALLELFATNHAAFQSSWRGKFPPGKWLDRVLHAFRRNTRAGARRNIHAHYDLGNAFYSRWLDPTMSYSCARFEGREISLCEAQTNKYRALAKRIGLGEGQHVLEIGCGWGGFASFAAREAGARVTGITISKEQYDFARRRVFQEGLADNVEILLTDYRDVRGQFDRVASIEMFEAVGERYWPAFFGKVRDSLKPGGLAGLQIITIADESFAAYRRGVDFIQRYVFPGGVLPSMNALRDQAARAGLGWRDNVTFAEDYARTLGEWRRRFLSEWDDIRALGFDERFRRLWTYYLSYCEAGFRARAIDVTQITLARA